MLKDKTGKTLTRSEGEAIMKGRAAVTVTMLAAILAIITLIANSNSGRVTTANIQANDIYAFYQAKSIKQSFYEFAADQLEQQSRADMGTMEQLALDKKITYYKSVAAKYESDPKTGEGKRELLARARQLEAERDQARARSPWYSFSQALLQIAIVLSSSSILAVSMALLWSSVGVGIVGVLLFVNGMWIHIPWFF
jgi:Domain of unknown function (DUF4337)